MAEQPPVDLDYKTMCVGLGCKTPARRALVAAGVATVVGLAIKQPSVSFTKEGNLRPLKATSDDPEATNAHFLMLPLGVAIIAGLIS